MVQRPIPPRLPPPELIAAQAQQVCVSVLVCGGEGEGRGGISPELIAAQAQ